MTGSGARCHDPTEPASSHGRRVAPGDQIANLDIPPRDPVAGEPAASELGTGLTATNGVDHCPGWQEGIKHRLIAEFTAVSRADIEAQIERAHAEIDAVSAAGLPELVERLVRVRLAALR